MTYKNSKKVYYTDFDKLERSSYKGLTSFAKEIVDKMIELSTGEKPEITPEVLAKIDLVTEGFKDLTERQKKVLELTFGLNENPALTESEIGKELKITHQSVHELKKRALASLSKRVILEDDVIKNIKKIK